MDIRSSIKEGDLDRLKWEQYFSGEQVEEEDVCLVVGRENVINREENVEGSCQKS